MAEIAYYDLDYYHSLMWLREALNRQRAEKADNKTLSQTLKFLGYSYYKVGPYVGPCEILAVFYLAWLVMTSFLFFTEFMRYIYPYSPGLFHELGGHSWWRHQMETFSLWCFLWSTPE